MAARRRAAMTAAARPCTWGSERPGSGARGAADFILHTNPTNCLPIVRFGLKLVATGVNIARVEKFRHCADGLDVAASGPIPKFASARVTFGCELRNLRTTSNF